jgi:hypothetical protein
VTPSASAWASAWAIRLRLVDGHAHADADGITGRRELHDRRPGACYDYLS